ncbi:MAG TPA: chemotaxis protein CheW [Nitrospirales bacterium]|nr:chemotaxis protein CheW [Nitrospirales bacterium]
MMHLARPREAAQGATATEAAEALADGNQYVTCRIGLEEFAIDILCVQEINRLVEITKVPKAPPFVEGVINLRGRIIPVLDLRRRFGLSGIDRTVRSRIVVVTVQGKAVGLLVDMVSEVLRVPQSMIEPPPAFGNTPGSEFVQGVARLEERLLIVLDLSRVMALSDQTAG